MKNNYLTFLLLPFLAFACVPYSYQEHQPLTTLPTTKHHQPVDIFYEDEDSPSKDYVEFYELRVAKRGRYNASQMIKFLRQEARKKGVDGVINIKKSDETEETVSFFDFVATLTDEFGDSYTSSINYSIIEGIGIKYIENIDLTKSVKLGKMYAMGSNKDAQLLGDIHYLPNGRIEHTTSYSDTSRNVLELYRKYSEDRLLYEEKNWVSNTTDEGKILARRHYRLKDWLLERVRPKYDDRYPERIKAIRHVEEPNGPSPIVTKIQYRYNDNGTLKQRKVTGAARWDEHFVYSGEKLLMIRWVTPEKEYQIHFEHYKNEDIYSMLESTEGTN